MAVKRVLMTADAIGGVWTYTRELTEALSGRGVETLVAVMGGAPREQLAAEVRYSPLQLEWQDRAGTDSRERAVEWLRGIADEFQPDLLHLNGYAPAATDWDVPVVVVAHSDVCSWWRAVHGCDPPPEWQLYRETMCAGLAKAAVVVAPTKAMLRELPLEREGRVIHNFTREPGSNIAKENFILAAGRAWDKAKNMAMLEEIAPRLDRQLRIAGGDVPRAEMRDLMSRAAVFAHPAKYEPFGLAVLEAARHRCALVLADIPSLRELWEGAAIFATDWVSALNSVKDGGKDTEELGQTAYRRSLEFTPERAADAYMDAYAEAFACA